MHQKMKRFLTAALGGLLIALSGCNTNPQNPKPQGEENVPGTQAAKGRYVEQQMTLPAEVGSAEVFGQLADGTLLLFGSTVTSENIGPWGVWQSQDSGESWQKKEYANLAELDDAAVSFASFDQDGGLYVYCAIIPADLRQKIMEQMRDLSAAGETVQISEETGEIESTDASKNEEPLEMPAHSLYYLSASGELQADVMEMPKNEDGNPPYGMKAGPNGDFLFTSYTTLDRYHPESKKVVQTYDPKGVVQSGTYTVFGNTVAMLGMEGLVLFDYDTGNKTAEIPYSADIRQRNPGISDGRSASAIAADPAATSLYFCNAGGIFRMAVGGTTVERIVAGDRISLGMPSITPRFMFANADGSLLVYCVSDNDESMLLRYQYDAEIPTVPSTELKIYSLEENKTLRQAIGMFQRENPDVNVSYTYGLTGADGITAADALRTLSTQLLANEGPDVLVLDGMPVDSYIEKGVLLDLSGMLSEEISTGELLPNIAKAFDKDGKLYAVPARFSVPMLHADDDVLASIHSVTDLANWLEQQEHPVINCTVPEYLIKTYYPICAPLWFLDDGTLDAQAFSQSLTDFQKMTKADQRMNDTFQYAPDRADDSVMDAIYWRDGQYSLNTVLLDTIKESTLFDAAIKGKGKGAITLFPGGSTYIPRTVLGVNAGGAQTELAQKFVQFTLSQQVLTYSFDDGMPVNAAALAKNAENPYSPIDDGMYYTISYTTSGEDAHEEYASMQVIWGSEEFMAKILSDVKSVQTAVPVNAVVQQMIVDETAAFFDGKESLEETVNAFQQKIDLYLAE